MKQALENYLHCPSDTNVAALLLAAKTETQQSVTQAQKDSQKKAPGADELAESAYSRSQQRKIDWGTDASEAWYRIWSLFDDINQIKDFSSQYQFILAISMLSKNLTDPFVDERKKNYKGNLTDDREISKHCFGEVERDFFNTAIKKKLETITQLGLALFDDNEMHQYIYRKQLELERIINSTSDAFERDIRRPAFKIIKDLTTVLMQYRTKDISITRQVKTLLIELNGMDSHDRPNRRKSLLAVIDITQPMRKIIASKNYADVLPECKKKLEIYYKKSSGFFERKRHTRNSRIEYLSGLIDEKTHLMQDKDSAEQVQIVESLIAELLLHYLSIKDNNSSASSLIELSLIELSCCVSDELKNTTLSARNSRTEKLQIATSVINNLTNPKLKNELTKLTSANTNRQSKFYPAYRLLCNRNAEETSFTRKIYDARPLKKTDFRVLSKSINSVDKFAAPHSYVIDLLTSYCDKDDLSPSKKMAAEKMLEHLVSNAYSDDNTYKLPEFHASDIEAFQDGRLNRIYKEIKTANLLPSKFVAAEKAYEEGNIHWPRPQR